jgi:hypothetical protein
MATQKTEAKIIVTAEDNASTALARVQARFDAMNAPVQRLQTALARPMQLMGLGRLTGSLGKLKTAMEGVPVAGTLFAAGGMALATQSLVANSVAAHDALGNLHDLSKAYKVGARDLQVFAEVGADSNVAVGDIAKGIGFLQQKIAGARTGDKAELTVLAGVGINADDLKGSATDVLKKISDVFKASTKDSDDAMKIDFAKKIFGKAGIGLIPMLEEGGTKYAEVFAKMQAEGRLFSDAQVEAADGTGDAWAASMRRIDGLRKTVGLAMAPMLESISQSIDKLMTGSARTEIIDTFNRLGETIAQEAPKFIAEIPAIVNGIGSIFSTVRQIGSVVGWDKLVLGGILFIASPFIAATMTMVGALGGLALSLSGVIVRMGIMAGSAAVAAVNGIRGIALAMRMMGLSAAASWAMALGPLLLVGAAVAAAAYLIYANWGGIVAFFGGVWSGLVAGLAPVAAAFEPVTAVVKDVFVWLGKLFGATSQSKDDFTSWAAAGQAAGQVLATVFKLLLSPIMLVIDAIKLVVAGFNLVSGFVGGQGAGAALPGGNKLPAGNIASPRTDVGGRLDIRVLADGQVRTERVESNNSGVDYNVNTGGMYGLGA